MVDHRELKVQTFSVDELVIENLNIAMQIAGWPKSGTPDRIE